MKSVRSTLAFFLIFNLLFPSGLGPQNPATATARPVQLSSVIRQSEASSSEPTVTLLPDGRSLLTGGQGSDGPLAGAGIADPQTGSTVALPTKMQRPRLGHTATLLPDGRVLIFGGLGSNGQIVKEAELLDLRTARFQLVPRSNGTPRAFHTATVLTDGRLLIAGGITSSANAQSGFDILPSLELWDLNANRIESSAPSLQTPRARHSATLLPDGTALLWGGVDDQAQSLQQGEIFDPVSGTLIPTFDLSLANLGSQSSAQLADSLPKDGATDVPLETVIALRFSEPLRMETVNPRTVTLSSSQGTVAAQVMPVEGGRLVFITSAKRLQRGITYTVSVSGPVDHGNQALPPTAFSFTTEEDTVSNSSEDEETWTPDTNHYRGNWRSGLPEPTLRLLPPLQAPQGITAVSGYVLTVHGKPLADVVLKLGSRTTQTDNTGRFLLASVEPGHQVLKVDGESKSPGKNFGLYKIGLDILTGKTNVLPFKIWLTRINKGHAVKFASPTAAEVVVTTSHIPGLEVHIPPGSVIRDTDGRTVTELSITAIPVDRPPFPLPSGVRVPVFFTVQPGGSYILPPRARLIYPNYSNALAGARIDFWNYDAEGKGWYVYGQGTVTPDGRQIVPDPGVAVYEFSGAMVSDPDFAPEEGPPPCDDPCQQGGDPVDLFTGLFLHQKTDLFLPDVLPIEITRTYRNRDSRSRAFGIGTTHQYDMFLVGDTGPYTYAELILPDGGRIRFDRTSSGTGFSDAIYEHTATPSRFFKSKLSWNGDGWDLKLKDGTVYVFPEAFNVSNPQKAALVAMRDRNGNAITFSRASNGNLLQITSPNGRWIRLTYDASNRITQALDNIGRTVGYTYDASGRLWKVTDPANGITEFTYDSLHQMLTVKDPRGNLYVTNEYNAQGRVQKQTQADNTTFQFAYTLDTNGKVTQVDLTEPNASVRRVSLNSSGYITTDAYALGQPEQQTFTYERQSGSSLVSAVIDPLLRRTQYSYDTLGNVTSVIQLAGTSEAVTTSSTYEPNFNKVAAITDPLNHTTTFGYDSKGNLTSVTDSLNHQTTFAYNTAGQVTSATDALQHATQFIYEFGDLTTVIDPLNRSHTRFTDAAGRVVSRTNPLGQSTRYDYDSLNRLVQITDPLQGATAFSYDVNDNLLSLTDARNNSTTYTYNPMNRAATRKDPLLREESHLYNNSGDLQHHTDRKSQVTQYVYDPLKRLKQITFADSSTITLTYDAGNRLIQLVDSMSGTIARSYDNLDRITSETTPEGSISYIYDVVGRRAAMTVAGQPVITYGYDNADRLTSIAQGSSVVMLAYDDADRRSSLTLPNGVVVEYGHDAASQLTSIDYKLGSTTLGGLTYEYDAGGKRTKVGGSFARTGLPQTLSTAFYDAANQLTHWGTATVSHDANGNMTGDGTNNYAWNSRDKLVAVEGGSSANFQYDGVGRRRSKTINGITTGFLHDGINPVQELSGVTPSANLLTGLGIDEFFVRMNNGAAHALVRDGLGSAIALLDSAGAIQTTYTFEPFGRVAVGGTPNTNAFQFTGRENDTTGLYFYRARYYQPTLQRFLSEDPIESFGEAFNPYPYVNNAPVDFIDPFGLQQRTPAQRGPANGRRTFPDGRGGKTVRDYDSDGKATRDIDHGHDHDGSGDPHGHDWDWSKNKPRQGPRPLKWWERLPWPKWPGPFPITIDPCLFRIWAPGCPCDPGVVPTDS